MLETTHLRPHFDELSEKKWCVFTIDAGLSLKLQQNAMQRLAKGQFRDAELAATQKVVSTIRNDKIFWLDARLQSLDSTEHQFLQFLETLKTELKQNLRVSLIEVECHYAHYAAGHFYKRHRDITPIENKRIFSFVLYLNPNWQARDGGELICYEANETLFQITPELGRFILFRSDLEHQVNVTQRDRLSLTGWFRC